MVGPCLRQARLLSRAPSTVCGFPAPAIRSSTSTSAAKRGTKYFTSSTFLYSGIFAAAATADAFVKAKRREEWTRAIDSVKRETDVEANTLERETTRIGGRDPEQDVLREESLLTTDTKEGGRRPAGVHLSAEKSFRDDTEQALDLSATTETDISKAQHESSKKQGSEKNDVEWRSFLKPPRKQQNGSQIRRVTNIYIGLPPTARTSKSPQPIAEPRCDLDTANVNAHLAFATMQSPRKQRMTELAAEVLILRMLLSIDRTRLQWPFEQRTEPAPVPVPRKLMKIWQSGPRCIAGHYHRVKDSLRTLRTGPENSPISSLSQVPPAFVWYRFLEREQHRGLLDRLHSDIMRTFVQYKRGEMSREERTFRLGCLLAQSPVSPDRDCYDVMLEGFSAEGADEQLACWVVKAVRESSIRPNSGTMQLHLDHYRRTEFREGYKNYVRQIRGQGAGLIHVWPRDQIRPQCEAVSIQKDTRRIARKPFPCSRVLLALVQAGLHLEGFHQTWTLVRDMASEGWILCTKAAALLLRACVAENDWHAGFAIWNHCKALQRRPNRGGRDDQESSEHAITIRVYVDMLELCVRSRKKEVYDQVFSEAVKAGHGPAVSQALGNEITMT